MEDSAIVVVSVYCLVYNQEKYLRQCLDGIINQRTVFPFDVIVHDDASIDGSEAIIDEYAKMYPNLIKPIFEKENQYSKHDGSILRTMLGASRSKYIAYCEGDDYWTDPLKLQRQFDYMEKYSEIGLCHTDYRLLKEQTGVVSKPKFRNGQHRSKSFEDHLVRLGYLAPMTWLARRNVLISLTPLVIAPDYSFALALEFFLNSKIGYIDKDTAVYRLHDGSEAHQVSSEARWKYEYGVYQIQLLYARQYGNADLLKKIKESANVRLLPYAIELENSEFVQQAIPDCISRNEEYFRILDENERLRNTFAFRVGNFLVRPLSWIKAYFKVRS